MKENYAFWSLYRVTRFSLPIVYLFLAYWLLIGQLRQTSNDAYISGNIVSIFPENQGHLSSILVKENELVIKGQPIAMTDGAVAYFNVKNAEKILVAAITQTRDMNNITYQLQDKTKNTLEKNEKNLIASQKKYKESLNAYSNKTLSLQSLKQAQIAVEKATDELNETYLKYNAAMSLPLYQPISDSPLIHEAMDELRLAYLNWIKSTIYAPETGYITARNKAPGQAVNSQTILMTMIPLHEIWVTAHIKLSQLTNIVNSESVKLISHANSQNKIYKGIIVGIDSKIQNTPLDSVSIRIRINPEQLAKYPLPFGLAMTAIINTRNHHEKSLIKINDMMDDIIPTKDYREEFVVANQIIDKIVEENTGNGVAPGTRFGRL